MRPIRLVAFDMDGVLVPGVNSWRRLHEHFGTDNSRGLEMFLRGEIDDLEFIRMDIALWMRRLGRRPHVSEVRDAFEEVHASPGAVALVAALRERGVHTAMVTGGVDVLAGCLAAELGIDHVYANGPVLDGNGFLTGEGRVEVPLRDKGAPLRDLRSRLHVPREECISLGDTHIDVPMFAESLLGIAVDPKDDEVRAFARYVVSDITEAKDIVLDLLDGRDVCV